MRIGLDVAQHQLLWPELAERVQFAESAGFGGAWVFDHFTPLYGDRNGPCLEAWTLLAGLAAITSRIRLGVLVTDHLPPPIDPGDRGDHRRPHLQWPARARPWGGLAPAGA